MILSVNIDHIATIRNARNSSYPNLLRAVEIVKDAGAKIVTIHLREDRRHIRDKDAEEICGCGLLPVNLEIAQTDEMIEKAILLKPKFVCIVPEKREEITTEGGLNVFNDEERLRGNVRKLQNAGIEVSLFVEAEREVILKAKDLGADTVELHTGRFADFGEESEFKRIRHCAKLAKDLGLNVHAGHGLTFSSASQIAKIGEIFTLHIGHFLITESIFIGLHEAVAKMRGVIE
jgi:pyridoxine 5-phosphate synthase